MSIKRVQRGLIYGGYSNLDDERKVEIELGYKVNPEKCIVNLRDRIQTKSSDHSAVLSSLVIDLTSTVLSIAPAFEVNIMLKSMITTIQTAWEIIEYN